MDNGILDSMGISDPGILIIIMFVLIIVLLVRPSGLLGKTINEKV